MNEEDKARIELKLEDLIAEHNVIDKELGEKIKDMKGFRNILDIYLIFRL